MKEKGVVTRGGLVTYAALAKKEPEDLLAAWAQTYPVADEEVKGDPIQKLTADDQVLT